MPQDKENEEEPGGEKEEEIPSKPDPFELKNHIRGISLLVVVCALLWILSKFGPGGADWVGNQTKALFGLEPVEESPRPREIKASKKSEPKEDPEVISSDPRIANAKQTIVETLGGPDRVIVQHIAISSDEKTMVAALKLTDPDGTIRLEEIFFEQDDFGRYISTEDSPVKTVIKIWKQE